MAGSSRSIGRPFQIQKACEFDSKPARLEYIGSACKMWRASITVTLLVLLSACALSLSDASSLGKRHHAHRLHGKRSHGMHVTARSRTKQTSKQVELQFYNIGTQWDPQCERSAAWCALACPIINARTEDHKFNYFTATIQRLHLELASCFILPKERYDYFMNSRFKVIARGQFMNNATPLPTRIANVGGQPVAIVSGHSMVPLTEFFSYISSKGVKMQPEPDYWKKHYCSNFPVRMAAALKEKNATRVNALMTQVSACTSIRIWGEIERTANLDAQKSDIIKSSVELAGKVIPLIMKGANIVTAGTAEAIDLAVDVIVKTAVVMGELSNLGGESNDGARDIVVAVCRAYRVPLEMALRYGEENPGFLAANTIPPGSGNGGVTTMLADAGRRMLDAAIKPFENWRAGSTTPPAQTPPAVASNTASRPATARTAF